VLPFFLPHPGIIFLLNMCPDCLSVRPAASPSAPRLPVWENSTCYIMYFTVQ